ncbi:copper amine oxidase N-terminal domain-containing protein [Paenibacillus athensensis]|nr:copper amine oxidase N-terminal domain-containing protein [Paenibacillus athensensis]MCD1259805.1 copper amine oxidase N-terminal domain-containing protein [Paenibacillus athensensis]
MKRTFGKKAAGAAAMALLTALVGCQSVGGVDVKQAMLQALDAPSSRSELQLTVQLTPAAGLTNEQQANLPKLRELAVDVPVILRADKQHVSYEGELRTPERTAMPFQAYVDGNDFIMELAGANKPIVWHAGLPQSVDAAGEAGALLQPVLAKLQQSVAAHLDELTPALINWLVANAPNPPTIAVTPEKVTVHGEELAVSKLHIAVGTGELGPWLKQLLGRLRQDETGTKKLLGDLYDIVGPDLLAADSGLSPLVRSVLSSKERSVELLYTTVRDRVQSGGAALLTAQAGTINGASLQLDLYLDESNQTRKGVLEAAWPRLDADGKSVATVTVKADKELWDIGQPVTAKQPVDTAGALELGSGHALNRTQLLHVFDPQSETFRFLKEDVRLAAKHVRMVMGADAGSDPGDSGRPFIRGGVTLVPARYVSENLDANIAWDNATRQVTITDETSGERIVLTIDSRMALVNGQEVELEQPATITGGSTYVPVRFIAEQLGAHVGWDAVSRTVSIVRE